MTRDEAIAAYWAATSHAEEHRAWQWLIHHGVVDDAPCPECYIKETRLAQARPPTLH